MNNSQFWETRMGKRLLTRIVVSHMKWTLVFAVAIVTVSVTGCAPSSAQTIDVRALKPVGVPTSEEKRAVYERVWQLFNKNYPSFQMKDVDWRREKSLFEPQAISAKNWEQFFSVVNEMILTLHDYHSFLINEPTSTTYSPAVLTTYFNGQLVVVACPTSTVIEPGMTILGVNGVSINNFMDGIGIESNQVPDFFRPIGWEIKDILLEKTDKPETVTVYNPQNGETLTDTLTVYTNQSAIWNQFSKQHPAVMRDFSKPSRVTFRSVGDDILYIDIPSMSDNLQQILESNMSKLTQAKGLIIDLRDNSGGNSGPGSWFAQHFYSKPTTALEYRRGGSGPWGTDSLQPLSPHISVPTAVLINGGDASSAEMFIAQLQAAPNVQTFGSRTMGADGNPKVYPVMDGVQVQISSWQERVVDTGLPIEQFGIAPKHEVDESYNDLLKEISMAYSNEDSFQYDDVLQQALQWVSSAVSGQS